MRDCDIFHNTGVGVCIAQGADPLIEKCRFFKGLSCGLLVQVARCILERFSSQH